MPYPFTLDDLSCPCCGRSGATEALLAAVNAVAKIAPFPIDIHSGFRCAAHNHTIGGAPHSRHLTGMAADIACAGLSGAELYLLADQIPELERGGIGLYLARFIHVDLRPNRARWFSREGHEQPIWSYFRQPELGFK
jgi:uncharacterized protein YcbK (DUF882 family)